MAGLDRIKEEILKEAQTKAADLLEEAQNEAAKQLDTAHIQAQADVRDAYVKAQKTAEEYRLRTESQIAMKRKGALLSARQQVISDIMKEAYERLLTQDDASYFDTLLSLVSRHAHAQAGQILLCEKDLARAPQDLAEKIEAAAQTRGGSLELSREAVPIDGGFILRYPSEEEEEHLDEDGQSTVASQTQASGQSVYGTVEENCSLQSLFEAKEEELSDLIREIVF